MKAENDLTLFAIELRALKVSPPEELRVRVRVRGRLDDWYTVKRWDFPSGRPTEADLREILAMVAEKGELNMLQLVGIQGELLT